MYDFIVPIVLVVFVWWASTAAVLWFSAGPQKSIPGRLMIATLLAATGFAAVIAAPSFNGWHHPLVSFAGALAVWAWVEFTFLTGLLTGSRTEPCPANISEWTRFRLAFRTINHHEYALVAALIVIGLCDWLASSAETTLWAVAFFGVLWLMRISAKLTIFSGAPSFGLEMMPAPIAHMKSYFRNDRIGPVFWVSTAVSTGVLVAGVAAFQMGLVDPDQRVGAAMLLSLFALAALEHWMMILPITDTALWTWVKPKNDGPKLAATPLNPGAQNATSRSVQPTKIIRATGAKPL
ncbi:MAG: putative photosynthetic complex assembly protein PuhE [Pseudomonadota bacterium]